MAGGYTPEERREYDRRWRAKNSERIKEYRRKYYAEHPELFKSYREKVAAKRRQLRDSLGSRENPLAEPCRNRKCRFLNTDGIPSCDYIRKMSKKRPCPPGEACTVYEPIKENEDGNDETN